ncbi:hypothetical protein C8T65DRAFT_586084, partial [Cerioporus squamosus]
CRCGKPALWRCSECIGNGPTCSHCLRDAHLLLPFHRVGFWSQQCWRAAWLRTLDVQVHLGHGSHPYDIPPTDDPTQDAEPEPSREPFPTTTTSRATKPRYRWTLMMVVVDTSGVHELPVVFCGCPNAAPRDIQLLRLGLYPATWNCPRTAFNFHVLDDFLLTNKECKTPAMSYYSRLRRITCDTFPHMVPDRYRDLLRISRQWRNLKARKNAGTGYPGVAPPGPGAFAIKCPACPWPGVNMAPGWESDVDRWKHAASVIMDGNFGAQHQKMKNPQDDVRFADGHGYMVTDGPYKAHLKTACKPKRQKLECNEHRAVIAAAAERAPLEATGIGAAACSRHGFFYPHCVVDFQRGEQQKNMDYCLFQVSAFLHGLLLLLVLYNVWCFYYKHLHWRFENSPALEFPPNLTITGVRIGQFHVHAHRQQCYPRFSPHFIPGAGVQLSEVIGTLWNKTNDISGSTRGMSSSHRQEFIDDHMNDSNWYKILRLAVALARKWRTACKNVGPAIQAFDDLTRNSPPEKVKEWTKAAEKASQERHPNYEAMDIYDVQSRQLPTKAQIQLQLVQSENSRQGAQKGVATWIVSGLKLEESNPVAEKLALEQTRAKLFKDIERFHKDSRTFVTADALNAFLSIARDASSLGSQWDAFELAELQARPDPGEDGDDGDDLPVVPERVQLFLPSTIGAAACRTYGLSKLVEAERKLRIGQMNDALHAVRVGIGYKSFLYRHSVRPATSQRQKLRSFDDIHVADDGILSNARVYGVARAALQRLYDSSDPNDTEELKTTLARYRVLERGDLRANTAIIESSVRGLSHLQLAWFWYLDVGADITDGSWTDEMYRVVWLRGYARKLRWEEEVVLVYLEMFRTVEALEVTSDLWETRTNGEVTGGGYEAWAARQSHRWRSLSSHAAALFERERSLYRPRCASAIIERNVKIAV